LTLAVTKTTYSGKVSLRRQNDSVSEASIAVDRKSMGHTVADRSSNEADFLRIFCIWRGGCGIVLCRLR
jgi:hypothetical protein